MEHGRHALCSQKNMEGMWETLELEARAKKAGEERNKGNITMHHAKKAGKG
jgi:hypothetical protein